MKTFSKHLKLCWTHLLRDFSLFCNIRPELTRQEKDTSLLWHSQLFSHLKLHATPHITTNITSLNRYFDTTSDQTFNQLFLKSSQRILNIFKIEDDTSKVLHFQSFSDCLTTPIISDVWYHDHIGARHHRIPPCYRILNEFNHPPSVWIDWGSVKQILD